MFMLLKLSEEREKKKLLDCFCYMLLETNLVINLGFFFFRVLLVKHLLSLMF